MDIKKFLTSGALKFAGPEIAAGIVSKFMEKVTVQEASDYVTNNVSIWEKIPLEHRSQLHKYIPQDVSWLTADWAIKVVAEKNPAVASLFLNWQEAKTWFSRQLEDLKSKTGVK